MVEGLDPGSKVVLGHREYVDGSQRAKGSCTFCMCHMTLMLRGVSKLGGEIQCNARNNSQ